MPIIVFSLFPFFIKNTMKNTSREDKFVYAYVNMYYFKMFSVVKTRILDNNLKKKSFCDIILSCYMTYIFNLHINLKYIHLITFIFSLLSLCRVNCPKCPIVNRSLKHLNGSELEATQTVNFCQALKSFISVKCMWSCFVDSFDYLFVNVVHIK